MSFLTEQAIRRPVVPLAPMIDILFLLLIFFVVTSTFRAEEQQMDIQLPGAQAAQAAEPTRTEVVINVSADGAIQVGNQQFELEPLGTMLAQLVRDFPHERVIVRGDRNVPYGRIMAVMDTARLAGVRDVRFATIKRVEDLTGAGG